LSASESHFNGEDPLDETERRLAAICLHYGLDSRDLEGWLFVGSGRDAALTIATQGSEGLVLSAPVAGAVECFVEDAGIGLVIVDPFISTHRVSENDNGAIDAVAKSWGRIAEKTNCAIELIHHTRKGLPGVAVGVDDGRGASSLASAARSVRVLNAMTRDEAKEAGVEEPGAVFRVDRGKANHAPKDHRPIWYRFASVDLGNGLNGDPGDNVGVVTPWHWPDEIDATFDEMARVQAALQSLPKGSEQARADPQSRQWLGCLVAQELGLDLSRDKARIAGLLKTWERLGYIVRERRLDPNRKQRDFFVVGRLVAPLEQGSASQGVAGVALDAPPHHPSYKGVVVAQSFSDDNQEVLP